MSASYEPGPVTLGLERLLASGRLRGKRVGLLANPASVDGRFVHSADRLREAEGVVLAALFGPQHGFQADVQDNMIESPHGRDDRRGVPVYSLYSETREPTPAMLADLDVLVVDLQDVGTRVYTFIYTMANCMRAAARADLPVIVCDRPNPLGGLAVQGPVLEKGYESFVGQFPIPLRHGLTIAELARLFNDRFGLGVRLDVTPLDGWRRSMYFDDTGLPWVMPSPNMPTLDTALVYPGAVLFEGTTLSEGRGTTRPFEIVGAPHVDAERLARSLNGLRLPGAHFRPVYFEPTFHKHAGRTCGGCQLHVTDRTVFDAVLAPVALMREIHAQWADRFGWRQPPYEYERERLPIDILAGTATFRHQIDGDEAPARIADSWAPGLEAFQAVRREYLLYPS
jgi:uncharacterized protein YbbC (DUF1343 family)